MKARMLCVLLLPACSYVDARYDYSLTWVCRSPDGCDRSAEAALLDRLSINGDVLWFESTRNELYTEVAQRSVSDSLPDGCYWLYGLSLFGYELEPSKLCSTSDGFELELSIPNRNPATHSEWLVEAREL
jgi:hypothetical protein